MKSLSKFICFLLTSALAARGSNMVLNISDFFQKVYVPIEKSQYAGAEVATFFSSLKPLGQDYCKMFWKYKPYNSALASKYIVKRQHFTLSKWCPLCLQKHWAGCANFFRMNDQKPNRDFKLMKLLYPKSEFDCYSVGFLQSYIMHNEMKCTTITMLDFDWRILDAHYQMIDFFKKKVFNEPQKIRQKVAKLNLAWRDRYPLKPLPRIKVSISTLCKKNQENLCIDSIKQFQEKEDSVLQYRLHLSHLKDGDFRNANSKRTKVIYLSNAIESTYTRRKDFDKTMKQLYYSMNDDGKAVLIHHAGGYSGFGIYEFNRTASKGEVTIVCRDLFVNTNPSSTAKYYQTYFSKVAENRKKRIPRCSRLLAKKKKELLKKQKSE